MATRWGIISAGNISKDFVTALNSLPKQEHLVVAVAARKLEDAECFAKTFNIGKAYGSYEELSRDADVDVVYVGSIHPMHISITKMMLTCQKPILCEKPLAVNFAETQEMINLAKERNIFLMEAIWSRCCPVYERLRDELQKGTIGDVRQIMVSFAAQLSELPRMKKKELGGGSMLDLGVYCVQLCQLVYGGEKPCSMQASGFLNEEGVDVAVNAVLKYSNDGMASFVTHTQVQMPSEAVIAGTKGVIKLFHPFWCPTEIEINGQVFKYPIKTEKGEVIFINSMGLMYEANEVRRCLKEGLIESPLITHDETLTIAEIMECLRKQVGVEYPQDKLK